jgi:hypothetical protein
MLYFCVTPVDSCVRSAFSNSTPVLDKMSEIFGGPLENMGEYVADKTKVMLEESTVAIRDLLADERRKNSEMMEATRQKLENSVASFSNDHKAIAMIPELLSSVEFIKEYLTAKNTSTPGRHLFPANTPGKALTSVASKDFVLSTPTNKRKSPSGAFTGEKEGPKNPASPKRIKSVDVQLDAPAAQSFKTSDQAIKFVDPVVNQEGEDVEDEEKEQEKGSCNESSSPSKDKRKHGKNKKNKKRDVDDKKPKSKKKRKKLEVSEEMGKQESLEGRLQ